MTDYKSEQADEIEALESIYMENFAVVEESPLTKIRLLLEPERDYGDEAEDAVMFVSLKLFCTFPDTYPDVMPEITVEPVKGIDERQVRQLTDKLAAEAEASVGLAMVFNLAEVAKDWLTENNKDMDESAYQDMLERMGHKDESSGGAKAAAAPEEEEDDDFTKARRLTDGKPVTPDSWKKWFDNFIKETRASKVVSDKATGRELFERNDASVDKFKETEDKLDAEIELTGANEEDLFVEGSDEEFEDLDDLDSDSEDDEDNDEE